MKKEEFDYIDAVVMRMPSHIANALAWIPDSTETCLPKWSSTTSLWSQKIPSISPVSEPVEKEPSTFILMVPRTGRFHTQKGRILWERVGVRIDPRHQIMFEVG